MPEVRLTGVLLCDTPEQMLIVERQLPLHIELTRAEPGCISFAVVPTDDPMVWQVDELFQHAASFAVHQQRVAGSEWGRATAGIERQYTVDGL